MQSKAWDWEKNQSDYWLIPCVAVSYTHLDVYKRQLLSNAIKFTPEGGRVELRVEEIAPVKAPDAVRYRFIVSDTGVGMSEAFLIHVFEPFTRDRNVTRVEGTGLGLSITKGLVDLMEGEITAESQERAGTVFRVELEFAAAQSASEGNASREDECSGLTDENLLAGRCFLIAEDNLINSEILSELLKMLGADSRVRVNGAEAVAAFDGAAPDTYDAVLMDIQTVSYTHLDVYKRQAIYRAEGNPGRRKFLEDTRFRF